MSMNPPVETIPEFSQELMARFSRHIILPQVGKEGQRRLAAQSALVIGMGGLGSPAALYLVAAGVGRLGLADYDTIELHNLQRQILHRTERIGTSKLDSAIRELRSLNPHTVLRDYAEGISKENALEIFSDHDIIVDGSDNFPTRYLVNDAAYFAGKPLVYGSIFQFEGQVSLFDAIAGGPCYRCLYPRMPAPGTVPNCSEAGVFGALCGVIGSLQAMETIKHLMGIGETLAGRLLVLDALSMNLRDLQLKKDPACPLCGPNPAIRDLKAERYEFECETGTENLAETCADAECPIEISVEEARSLLESEQPTYLLDVREPFEREICLIEGSMNIPMRQVATALEALPRDQRMLVHCHHGARSMQVVNFLRSKGFKAASNVGGGIHAWADRIDPTMNRY